VRVMIKYIGISGRIASGKSTLSGKMDRVFNAFDLFTVRSSFATGVKYLASLEHNSARWIHAERYFTRLSNSDVSRNIALLFDGFVLFLLFQFADYPMEKPMIAVSALNPIDLSRILILLQLDVSAMMGYTGAVFKDFFGTYTGIIFSLLVLILWIVFPVWYATRKFNTKDL